MLSSQNSSDTYLSLYTDFGFKRIFGTESNKELLRSFLNAILEKEEHIESLEFMNSEQLGGQAFERKAVYDVYCRNDKGDRFIVEMQCARQEYFKDRALFYSTFPIRDQALRGAKWDFRLDRIYAIGILDFVFDRKRGYVHTVMLSDIETGEVFYDKLKFIFIEMPKFHKREDELSTPVDKWLYALKYMGDFSRQPPALNGEVFAQLFEQTALAKLSHSERESYEESLKIARDNFNVVHTARKEGYAEGERKGLEIGLAKGEEIGLAKGEEIGLAKGEQRCLEKIRAQMRAMGLSTEMIEKATRRNGQ